MSFLTAEWNDLLMINYKIDSNKLEKYVPAGTELDLWNNTCYVSLIGFMFEDVKMLGVKVPFHVNFEEVNLRIYVKKLEDGKWKRGVVFIKEIVPKFAISWVANLLYNEHYETRPMSHKNEKSQLSNSFSYKWKKGNKWHEIAAQTATEILPIEIGSEAEFITEHYFGYTKYNEVKTIEYEVTHPKWNQYKLVDYKVDVDFVSVYGNDFAFLQNQKPDSAFVAIGSPITIEPKKTF
jgi:uncharacterized protein YqjF (DUF2071 family)